MCTCLVAFRLGRAPTLGIDHKIICKQILLYNVLYELHTSIQHADPFPLQIRAHLGILPVRLPRR